MALVGFADLAKCAKYNRKQWLTARVCFHPVDALFDQLCSAFRAESTDRMKLFAFEIIVGSEEVFNFFEQNRPPPANQLQKI